LALPDPPRAATVHTYLHASPPLRAGEIAELGGAGLFRTAPGLGMPYWRIHDDRLLFGGTDVAGLVPGEAADGLARAHSAVARLRRRYLPGHRGDVAYRWGGPIHVTATETPYVAASAANPRIVYAVGFAGSGVALALTCGPLVRDLVLGPASADPAAVRLRAAMNATRIPVSALLSVGAGAARRLFAAGQ
jgi:glycine/D-amino acid oxidase-like deaminating enzyme